MSVIAVTQNKVAGFEPRWASFPGFSILFDNPGDSTEKAGSLSKIACAPGTDGRLELYRRLDESLRALNRDHLIQTFLFCPLPPPAYHVTVWDGVNADNVACLRTSIRSDLTGLLRGLPDSLGAPPDSITMVTESELMRLSLGEQSFQFDRLSVWRNQALVARLHPCEQASVSFQRLCRARAELCNRARQELGISTASDYSPHVTLGYFANQQGGQLASTQVEKWTDLFRANLNAAEITFSSMALYGFTDMVSFFKLESADTNRRATIPHGSAAGRWQ